MTDQVSTKPTTSGWNAYTIWALFLLTMVATFSIADRAILAIVQEPLKHELGLSDGQLGLLNGIAFALLYAVVGLPVARLAESANRMKLLSFVVAVWSLVTALSGFATSFVQIAIGRALVGAAESGGAPMSHSTMSDIFPKNSRARAMSLYSVGIPLGLLLGGGVGGYAAHHWGWRMAFVAVGLPGLLIALAIRLTIKEPIRGQHDKVDASLPALPLAATCKQLLAQKSFLHLVWASAATGIAIYGVNAFVGSFFIRRFDMDVSQVGYLVGIGQGVAGLVGTLLGGIACDTFASRDARAYMLVPLVTLAAAGLLFAGVFITESSALASGMMIAAYFFSGAKTGPSWAAAQNLAGPRSRAIAAALVTLTITVAGQGLGPTAVGFLSDFLAGRAFPETLGVFAEVCKGGRPIASEAARIGDACRIASASGIQTSLLVACLAFLWAVVHYALAMKTVRKDMAAV